MKLHPVVQAFLGGLVSAIVVASPIVDDGLLTSEILSIAGAFLVGSGLTAVAPTRKDV